MVKKPKPKPIPLVQQIKFDPIPDDHPHADDLRRYPGMKIDDDNMVGCYVCQRFAAKDTSWVARRPYEVAMARAQKHWDSLMHANALKRLLEQVRAVVLTVLQTCECCVSPA